MGKGFDARFPDLPEALTSGDDLAGTLVQAADCVPEAIAVGIARAGPIPGAFETKRGRGLIRVRLFQQAAEKGKGRR